MTILRFHYEGNTPSKKNQKRIVRLKSRAGEGSPPDAAPAGPTKFQARYPLSPHWREQGCRNCVFTRENHLPRTDYACPQVKEPTPDPVRVALTTQPHLDRPCYSPEAILARVIQKGADCDDDEALDMAADAVREIKAQGYTIAATKEIPQ